MRKDYQPSTSQRVKQEEERVVKREGVKSESSNEYVIE